MTPEQMLAAAQTALHQLQIGAMAAEVMVDGYLVRYTRANVAELRAYVARLEAIVNGRRVYGAVGFTF
jgi:organic hydroperoxide reductase OsmC/OhrA